MTNVRESTAPLAAVLRVKRRDGTIVDIPDIARGAYYLEHDFDASYAHNLLWNVAASNLCTAHRLPERIPAATEALRLLLDSEGRMIEFEPVPGAGFVRRF